MESDAVIGSLEFTLGSILKPWDADPGKFLIEADGKIGLLADEGDEDAEVIAGTIKVVLVKIAEAIWAGADLYQVFDHSTWLEATYGALFDSRGCFRRRHKIKRDVDNLLFIESIHWEPGFGGNSLLAQTIETTIALLAPSGLVVGYTDDLNQFGLRWQKHGFRSAGKSGIILRDNLDFPPEEMATWTPPDESVDEIPKREYPKLADD